MVVAQRHTQRQSCFARVHLASVSVLNATIIRFFSLFLIYDCIQHCEIQLSMMVGVPFIRAAHCDAALCLWLFYTYHVAGATRGNNLIFFYAKKEPYVKFTILTISKCTVSSFQYICTAVQ